MIWEEPLSPTPHRYREARSAVAIQESRRPHRPEALLTQCSLRGRSGIVHAMFYEQGAFRFHPAASRTGPRRCRAGCAHARPAGRDGDGARRGHACRLPRRDQGRRHRRGPGPGALARPRRPRHPPRPGAQGPFRPPPPRGCGHGRCRSPRPDRGEGAAPAPGGADRHQLDRHRPQFRLGGAAAGHHRDVEAAAREGGHRRRPRPGRSPDRGDHPPALPRHGRPARIHPDGRPGCHGPGAGQG
ncbi:hypothetical protein QFZ27_003811 [Inquilinus ginsengisoli]